MTLPATASSTSLEADFLEYRRSGDPAALARVFDQVAPELLLVAAHLIGGGRSRADEAEDLLQSTFVAAIESAARYDPARPLRGWLVGILVHMAQRARRERRRVPDPTRVELVEPLDPEQLAVDAEFAERFQRALAALPQPYRNVLTLRLVHGLRPLAIAHAQGVPPATVRSQLRRGLEILRQALPAGFAVASLLVMARAQGLATVRAAVLEHAQRLAAAAGRGAGAATAVRAGARPGVLAAAAVLVAGLAALAFGARVWGTPAPAPAAPVVPLTQAPAAPATGAAGRAVDPSAVARTPALAAATRAGASLILKFRHAADQSPAAGVALRLLQDIASDNWLGGRSGVTGEDGVFRADGLAAGDYTVVPDRAASLGITLPEQGVVTRAVDLPAGVDLLGKVVDDAGQPVAGAQVLVSDDAVLDEVQCATSTDAGGLFRLRGVEPGRSISAIAPGFRPSVLRQVPAAAGPARIKLVLDQPGAQVRGLVLDPEGRPVAGALVMIGRMNLRRKPDASHATTRRVPVLLATGADGRFATRSAPADAAAPLWVRALGYRLWSRTLGQSEPAAEVLVQLEAGARVAGTVRDAEGRPVPDAQVRALDPRVSDLGTDIGPRWATCRCTVDAAGRYLLIGVAPGPVTVCVDQLADRPVLGEVTTHVGATAQLDLVLASRAALRGVVTDEHGAPQSGFQVQATPGAGLPQRAQVVTDGHGRFAVEHCSVVPHTVEVWEPGSAWQHPTRSWVGVVPGGEPLTLALPEHRRASARVRGELRDEHGAPAAVSVVLAWPGLDGGLTRTEPETGRFEFGPVPPGRYVVLARRGADVLAVVPLFALRAGETRDLEPQTLPRLGRLVVRATPPPGVATESIVQLFGTDGVALTSFTARRDPPSAVQLPPGRYFLAGASVWPRRAVAVAVRVGEETQVELVPEPGVRQAVRIQGATPPLWLELTDLDAPADARVCQRMCADLPVGQPGVRPALPRGRFQFRITDARGRSGETTVVITDPTRTPPDVDVTLR